MDWFTIDWLVSDAVSLPMVPLTAVGIYAALILWTRIMGLRSFSKMSGFDFAITVAMGSLVAATAGAPTPSLAQGVVAISSLFLLQLLVARLRVRSPGIRWAVDNEPLLLMDGERMLEANMRSAGVSEADLLAKLREANVLNRDQIRAVVFESTGDISVLHTMDGDDVFFDRSMLLSGVRSADA